MMKPVIDQNMRIEIISRFHQEKCSCIIYKGGKFTIGRERGVADLFRLLNDDPEILSGAFVADKVVGKGAAALMVVGGVRDVHADVISRPAVELLKYSDIEIAYGKCVPNIINRSNTGICPVEELCSACKTAEDCLPLIERFIKEKQSSK